MQRSPLGPAPKHLNTLVKLAELLSKDVLNIKELLLIHVMKTLQLLLEGTSETLMDMMHLSSCSYQWKNKEVVTPLLGDPEKRCTSTDFEC